MVWHKRPSIRTAGRIRGMTLIEVTATMAMLGIAGVAIAKWVAVQAKLNRQSESHLAAAMSAQNAVERLRLTSFNEFERAIESMNADAANSNLRFQIKPFELDTTSGLHLRIDAIDDKVPPTVLASEHVWRIRPPETMVGEDPSSVNDAEPVDGSESDES